MSTNQMVSIPENNSDLQSFIKKIHRFNSSRGQLHEQIQILPDSKFGDINECYENVRRKVNECGGKIVYGWKLTCVYGLYLEAEFHSVWRKPSGGMVDITTPEDNYSNLTHNMFLEVDKPVYEKREIPSLFYSLKQHPIIKLLSEYRTLVSKICRTLYIDGELDKNIYEKHAVRLLKLLTLLEQPLVSPPNRQVIRQNKLLLRDESIFKLLESKTKNIKELHCVARSLLALYLEYSEWLEQEFQSSPSHDRRVWLEQVEQCLPTSQSSNNGANSPYHLGNKLFGLIELLAEEPP